jgi:cytochrome c biogenesis protein CcmG/thiol:disulfide interchange protein DsbE
MRRLLTWAPAIVLAIAGHAGAAAPGTPAPPFVLEGQTGPVKLSNYQGKYVYLDFWASWCAPCKRSFPWMGELQKRYGANGLQVVAINVDATRADAERFLAQTPAGFVVAWDPAGVTPLQYAIKGMPSSVLIDPAGNIVFVHAGYNDDSARKIEDQIKLALKGKP